MKPALPAPFRRLPSAYAAAAIALWSVALGMLVPVYTDEVGWRFQARMAIDGVDRFVAENCGANTLAKAPLFMRPFRQLSATLNTSFADPFYIRLAGVACALAWLGLLWRLAGQLGRTRAETDALRTMGLGLASLGLLPFMLVISRPEQPILLALTAALCLATRGVNARLSVEDGAASSAIKAGVVALCGMVALSYHLKGIVFMPVFLAAAAFSSRGAKGRWYRTAASGALIGMTVVALPYWIGRFRCPADPLLAAKLGQENIASVIFNAGPIGPKIGRLLGGLNPLDYILLTVPKMRNMSDWLPPHILGHGAALGWTILIMICWAACMIAAIGGLVAIARRGAPDRSNGRRIALALPIIATVMAWSVAQIHKNVYESALTAPLTILSFMLVFTAVRESRALGRLMRALSRVALGCAAVSVVLLTCYYGSPLLRIARQPGYIAAQKSSLSAYGYGGVRDEIRRTGALCGLTNDRTSKGVLTDDLTYIAYMNSWRPLHRTGVLSNWNGSISDPAAYLRAHQSSGAVIGCHYLPPGLRARARQNGPYCCLDARF